MGTFKAYASGNNMGYITASGSTWTTSSARQGTYSSTKYYGAMFFGNLPSFNFEGKTITNIMLTMDFNAAGANAYKTLYLYGANKASLSGTGSAMLGESIGSVSGMMYSNTLSWNFNSITNAATFVNMLEHFSLGNTGLAIYKNETSPGSPAWSTNYLSIAAVTMTITFEEGFVWHNTGGTWIKCAVHYCDNGTWKRCKTHYNNGGTWV